MTQHTPGPWWFDKHANAIVRATVRPDALAQFCEYVGPPDAADLSLMVSAPELLEALEGAAKNCHICDGKGSYTLMDEAEICQSPGSSRQDCQFCAPYRAAIKSARGQQ